MSTIQIEFGRAMPFSAKFGFHGVKECVRRVLDITEGSDRDELCGGKVGCTEECSVIEYCRFRKPGACAVKDALEKYTTEVNFS